MKNLIHILVCTSLLINSPYLFANKYQDQAEKMIAVQKERAELAGASLAQAEFEKSIMEISSIFSNHTSLSNEFLNLQRLAGKQYTEFNALLNEKLEQKTLTKEDVLEAMSKYESFWKLAFEQSWALDSSKVSLQNTSKELNKLIERNKYYCSTGISNFDDEFTAQSIPVPEFKSTLGIRFSPNPLGPLTQSGGPMSAQVYSGTGTAGSKAANHDRANATAVATTYMSMTTDALLAQYVFQGTMATTGVLGNISSFLVGAAPVGLVVAAAVIVIVNALARREAAKIAEQVVNANLWAVANAPTSDDVARIYTENCENKLEALGNIQTIVDEVILMVENSIEFDIFEEDHLAIEKLEQRTEELESPQGLMNLNLFINTVDKKCESIAEVEDDKLVEQLHKWEEEDKYCHISRDEKYFVSSNQLFSLPVDDNEREKAIAEAKETIDQYDKDYPAAEIARIAGLKIKHSLSSQKQIFEFFEKKQWEIKEKQQQNFFRLNKLLRAHRKIQRRDSKRPIFKELRRQQEYDQLFERLVVTASQALKGIYYGFEHLPGFYARLSSISQDIHSYKNKYSFDQRAVELWILLQNLEKSVGESQ